MKNQTSTNDLSHLPSEKLTNGIKTACNIARALAPTVILAVTAAVIIKKMDSKESE